MKAVIVSALRGPAPLPQVDDRSCYSNVIAQIRWMYGTAASCTPGDVRLIDSVAGTSTSAGLWVLLRDGFQVADFSAEDPDDGDQALYGPVFASYPDQFTSPGGGLTRAAVDQMLDAGWAVVATVRSENGGAAQAMLITGREPATDGDWQGVAEQGDWYYVYYPESGDDGIGLWWGNDLEDDLLTFGFAVTHPNAAESRVA